VISDASARQHHLDGPVRDWWAFFDASEDDPPIAEGLGLATSLARDRVVALVTARPARLAPTTLAWLDRHRVRWDLIAMRTDDDHRTSSDTKRDLLADLRVAGYQPVLALDDDVSNLAMYRTEGVATIYVHSGYYDDRPGA